MAGNEKVDPEFRASSSWELGGGRHGSDKVSDHGYLFGIDYRESSILSEFGWNIPAESTGGFVDLDRIEFDLAGGGADGFVSVDSSAPRSDDTSYNILEPMVRVEKVEASVSASPSNPSLSSSSSEDPPEKPTDSGVSSAADAATPPSDTASKSSKKKVQKRIRQQRFAFVTKSEVDHLEDGYRWRKYGQKAVKNSPFPRSYYRCTNSKCMVKKRVERSYEDPSVVITTYEGQHCHHSVGLGYPSRGSLSLHLQDPASASYFTTPRPSTSHFIYPQQNSLHNITQLHNQGKGGASHGVQIANSEPLAGQGLLGDIVPPGMRKG
ncbi:putative WRKY transcription factor 57 [Sesamum alatum]|uniref:WRKY transcription factor 57 n=1 Tax=Sesamum alatum TaxID=300844 RepID=A0AAE1YH25_9LAMI|nr:putative WRKY transcription factor 57 [Sesamum alatum]